MNSSDASFQMEWTPIQKSISNPISVTENKPKRQLEHLKPRMSIKGASATQPFDPRASMFSSSVKTESTNFTSESIASLNNGSFCMFNSSICRRSSIFFGDERRQTVNTKKNSTDLLVDDSKDGYEEFKEQELEYRPSDGSLNDRASNIEGQLNTPNTDTCKVKSRSGNSMQSPVRNGGAALVSQESLNSNNSGSKRMKMREEIERDELKDVKTTDPFLSED